MQVAYRVVLLALLLIPVTGYSEPSAPNELIVRATEKIIDLLKTNREVYAKDHDKLYAMVYEHIVPNFDFRMISKLVLARYWKQATAEQRVQFAERFRDQLVRTYATALLKYKDEQFIFLPFSAKSGAKRVIVKTEFHRSDGGPNVSVNYRLYSGKSGWKVYDLMIEGVSLVSNYRTVYAEKIKKEGIDALIASLVHTDAQASK